MSPVATGLDAYALARAGFTARHIDHELGGPGLFAGVLDKGG